MEQQKRVLATIGKIVETLPIPNADRIIQATVLCGAAGAWTGVLSKDVDTSQKFLVFLQDAVVPQDPRWAFMEKYQWRVRMMRFRGAPSECVILEYPDAEKLEVGTDLTEILGVTKHNKPLPLNTGGEQIADFPWFIRKTDETNFQASLDIEKITKDRYYVTEKADGTSGTAWVDGDGVLHVCARQWELAEFDNKGGANVYWTAARKYGLHRLPVDTAIQFEVVGPGIAKNPLGLKELEIRVFRLWDNTTRRYLPYQNLKDVCHQLDLPTARCLGEFDPMQKVPTAEEFRKMAEIKYSNGRHAEGIVIQALDTSWSFKVINLLYKD